MLLTQKRLALICMTGCLVVGSLGCQEEREFDNTAPNRSRLFERTDRIFEDVDDLPECSSNIADVLVRLEEINDFRDLDLNDDDVSKLIELGLAHRTSVLVNENDGDGVFGVDADLDDDVREFIIEELDDEGNLGLDPDEAFALVEETSGLLLLLGINNSLLLDLTRSPRQGIEGRDNLVGFPDSEGPLFGSKECSPATKTWAGGYYKRASMPRRMGKWCEKYGLEEDCQAGLGAKNGDPDLQISYFNAHALPVFRITLCNDKDFVKNNVPGNGEFADQEFDGVGFACVNLNYICPERVAPGVITLGALQKVVEAETGQSFNLNNAEDKVAFFRAVNQLELGVKDDRVQDAVNSPDEDFQLICDNPEADANCQRCEAVSVTMHYDFPRPDDPKPIVVFGAYRGVGESAELMDRIDLNFSGKEEPFETIPNICNSCHGGDPYEPLDPANPDFNDIDMQTQFLPINFRFALEDAQELNDFLNHKIEFDRALMTDFARAPEEEDRKYFFKPNGEAAPLRLDTSSDLEDTDGINALIAVIDPLAYNGFTAEALNDTFTPRVGDADELNKVELHDDDEIPRGWQGKRERENMYRIVAEHCNDGCHLALPPPLDFQSFEDFAQYRSQILNGLCRDYSMPHSPEAFNLFWSRSERITNDKEDNPRLNKGADGALVDFDERDEADEREDLRGDVELFLEYEDDGWEPLTNEVGTDFGQCRVPPAASTFNALFEITNFLVLDKKREECIKELTDGSPEPGRLSCVEMCRGLLFNEDKFVFTESADVNAVVCDNLAEAAGLDDRKDIVDPTVEVQSVDRSKLLTVESFFEDRR